MSLHKQAKVLTPKQIELALTYLSTTRDPLRNQIIFLFSSKAGLRAKEIASLQWAMLIDGEGELLETISLTNQASKGQSGRHIPINKLLFTKIKELFDQVKHTRGFDLASSYVVTTQRSKHTSPQAIVNLFSHWYKELNFVGCSSHSGRRTFITNCSRRISTVGGSLRDVQSLAGHSSLQTTQRYIEVNTQSKALVVNLI